MLFLCNKMKVKKEYCKITKQDIEIAEVFFENDKHLDEFISNVFRYYLKKDLTIKTKIVKKYFETYKKTMDYVLEAKEFGLKGYEVKSNNQEDTEDTLEGVLDTPQIPLKDTLEANSIKDNNINNNSKDISISEVILAHPLQEYIVKNFDRVSKMKIQMTYENCEAIIQENSRQAIIDTLEAMENYKDLSKRISVYLTLKKWLKNDFSKGKTISTGQPSKMESMVNSAKEALNMLNDE